MDPLEGGDPLWLLMESAKGGDESCFDGDLDGDRESGLKGLSGLPKPPRPNMLPNLLPG